MHILHTSGHVDIMTIDRLVRKVNPKIIILVYAENAEWFEKYKIAASIVKESEVEFLYMLRNVWNHSIFNVIYFVQDRHLYVTKKITCQKSLIFRTFLRMWTLKFYSQNRGSPKAFFECFWDLNGRFFIFKRCESRFGEKIPKSALFYPEKLSQSFWRFLVRYAEPIEK